MTLTIKARHLILAGAIVMLSLLGFIAVPEVQANQESKRVEIIRTELSRQGVSLMEQKRVKNTYLIGWTAGDKAGAALWMDGLIIPINTPQSKGKP